jgi:hypothetical protein
MRFINEALITMNADSRPTYFYNLVVVAWIQLQIHLPLCDYTKAKVLVSATLFLTLERADVTFRHFQGTSLLNVSSH